MHSVEADRIFDGRLIFRCSKCRVCGIVRPHSALSSSAQSSLDDAYLDFLDQYDNGQAADEKDFSLLAEQEKIIRPASEINLLLSKNGASDNELLSSVLKSRQDYVVDYQVIDEPAPEQGSNVAELALDDALKQSMLDKGIERLHAFQEQAISTVLSGADTAIVAPTASGKTEAFCIPILQKISERIPRFGSLRPIEGKGRNKRAVSAIFVYPTKALARDQAPKIKELAASTGIRVDVLDGDTEQAERDQIASRPPDILITNFDVLHYHMMHRTKFSRMLMDTRFLVVDEAHSYTGVFGANVHYIVRRLERLVSAASGHGLQIIAASATLPNAGEFCQALFGRKMQAVYGRGRKGRVNFAILFPSLRSYRSLMIDLVKKTAKTGHKTIAFSGSHLGSELLAFYASRQGIKIKVHRAGLLPAARAEVERAFKAGELMAVSATPTLELGIDIGDVDAVVSNIVPINRLVQRFGRAARRGQEGYAFLVLGNDPISQYYKMHPQDYLADSEYAYTDPSNPFVEEYQILAMACDRPITMPESAVIWSAVQRLVSKGLLRVTGNRFLATREAVNLLNDYSIRGIGSRVDITLGGKIVGERSLPQALEELHPGAVYFLSGRRYQVAALHYGQVGGGSSRPEKKPARLREGHPYAELVALPPDYPYYTKAITDEWPSILEIYEKKRAIGHGAEMAYCSLLIRKRVLGYANMEIGQDALQGRKVMLDRPLEHEFPTKGFVFRAPRPLDSLESAEDPEYVEASSYHASEHVLIEGSAMITGGASQDLGGISLSSGLIFVYDGSTGGNGASKVLYDRVDRSFERALRILSECQCKSESGCPRCTYSYRCGNNNEYLHKASAIEVLNRIVEGEQTEIGDIVSGDRALV